MSSHTYNVPQVSELLGVSKASIYTAIKMGEFPFPVIKIGGRYVIPRQPVDAAINPEINQ